MFRGKILVYVSSYREYRAGCPEKKKILIGQISLMVNFSCADQNHHLERTYQDYRDKISLNYDTVINP